MDDVAMDGVVMEELVPVGVKQGTQFFFAQAALAIRVQVVLRICG